jgi:hypothetical protein
MALAKSLRQRKGMFILKGQETDNSNLLRRISPWLRCVCAKESIPLRVRLEYPLASRGSHRRPGARQAKMTYPSCTSGSGAFVGFRPFEGPIAMQRDKLATYPRKDAVLNPRHILRASLPLCAAPRHPPNLFTLLEVPMTSLRVQNENDGGCLQRARYIGPWMYCALAR